MNNLIANKKVMVTLTVALLIGGYFIFRWNNRITDKIDYPFINDPQVIGSWQGIDFVSEISEFKEEPDFIAPALFINDLEIKENGKVIMNTDNPRTDKITEEEGSLVWTRGIIINKSDKIAGSYEIKEITGKKYLFYQWKNGDYTYGHQTPKYYVLKKL